MRYLVFLVLLFPLATSFDQDKVKIQPKKVKVVKKQMSFKEREIKCLADNIFHEASGEDHHGKQAVGFVTMNRVKSKLFPKTVCGVVYQKYKRVCQFSWVCSNAHKYNSRQYAESMKIAQKIYSKSLHDITYGSLFFHNAYVYPNWASQMEYTVAYGMHIFYKKPKKVKVQEET